MSGLRLPASGLMLDAAHPQAEEMTRRVGLRFNQLRERRTMPYKDPEKQREADRRWREANPEKAREAHRRWREANPDKQREATRRWHEANPEYGRWQSRNWRGANLEKARAREAAYRAANREARLAYMATYKASQKEARRLDAWEATFEQIPEGRAQDEWSPWDGIW
jgi:hypothetical protein